MVLLALLVLLMLPNMPWTEFRMWPSYENKWLGYENKWPSYEIMSWTEFRKWPTYEQKSGTFYLARARAGTKSAQVLAPACT